MRTCCPVGFVSAATMFAAFMSGTPASANEWKFDVVNGSNLPVLEFRTQEEGEWSENWIDQRIEPGDEIELDFETDKGDCVVRTQIRFIDGSFFDADVDYCKASTLEISGDTLVWK